MNCGNIKMPKPKTIAWTIGLALVTVAIANRVPQVRKVVYGQ